MTLLYICCEKYNINNKKKKDSLFINYNCYSAFLLLN